MFDFMNYEERKAFDDYIKDCQKPDKKAKAVKEKAKLEVYRKYKAEILQNPDGMKLQAGKTYNAQVIEEPAADQRKRQTGEIEKASPVNMSKEDRLAMELRTNELEYRKNELRHQLHKNDHNYSPEEYRRRKADLILQRATLKLGGSLERAKDGRLIEYR